MQRMILVPVDQYDRMIESYEKAMEELYELREQLKSLKEGDFPVDED